METKEGRLEPNGNWTSFTDKHRSLTAQEVLDIQKMAETTTPKFGGPDNATWEDHHPLAREIWEKKGLKPAAAK